MPECSDCGSEVNEEATFCPTCGEPQRSDAKRKAILGRISYAVGFVFVVAGVSVLPDNPGGIPVVLGGIQLFPPMRHLLGRVLGRPPKIWANAALSLLLVGIGVVVITVSGGLPV
jgi:hypothetical protein